MAKLFKNKIVFLTLIIFLFFLFIIETTHPAPFFSASLMNLFPSLYFPLIARNKFSFLIVLVSIESPLNLKNFDCLVIFLKSNYSVNNFDFS